jgi:hypothetical protein
MSLAVASPTVGDGETMRIKYRVWTTAIATATAAATLPLTR